MKNARASIAIALGLLSLATAAQGSLIYSIYSDGSDGSVYQTNTGIGSFPTQDLIVGGASGANYAGVAIFQLPDLGGGAVLSANLTFTVRSSGTMPSANADIYGLGYVSSPPSLDKNWVLIGDSETRDGNTLGTNLGADLPVKLLDNAVTAGTTMHSNETTVVSGSGLIDFVNSLYTVYGASAGDFAVFRVNPDADQFNTEGIASNFRYGGSDRGAQATLLTLTVGVPEPSSALLLAGLIAGCIFSRRARQR